MKLFNVSFALKGFPLKRAKQILEKISNIPENAYDAYVTRKKEEILDYHFKNNTFYRNLCGDKKPILWENVPILTKRDLQQPLKLRISSKYASKKLYVNKTSGSSGQPFIFAKNKLAHAITWANVIRKFGAYKINFNTSYQARFYGIPKNKVAYYTERLKDVFLKRYRFSIFNLNDATLAIYLETFKSRKFDYINGYTSSLVLFATFLKEQDIVLKDICPTLKYCFTTSEMLFEDDKILLETYFGIPVINEYGASEFGLIAFENTNKELQICTENLFVEVLDENDQVLPLGVTGRIIITDLYNKAHPFIRFEIGDIGSLSKTSTSKHTVLENLQGRISDIAILPSGKKVPGLTFYYVTKSIMKDDALIKEFIITQKDYDSFIITYVAEKDLTENEISNIKEAMNAYLEPNLKLELCRVNQLKRTAQGKLKQFTKAF